MLPSISSWMMLPIIFHIISIYSIIITFIFHHLPYVSPALPSLCPRSWSATHWRCRPRCHAAPECSALRSWNEPRCWMILEWNDWIFCVFQTNWVETITYAGCSYGNMWVYHQQYCMGNNGLKLKIMGLPVLRQNLHLTCLEWAA